MKCFAKRNLFSGLLCLAVLFLFFLQSSSAATTVLQGPSLVSDTYLQNKGGIKDQPTNDVDFLILHCNSTSSRFCPYRPLVKFDLSSLQGQQVAGAFLSLYDFDHPAFPFSSEDILVHEMATDWTPFATLLTKDGNIPWANEGGDFVPEALDSLKVGNSKEWKSWDVTSSLNKYISSGNNYGWIIRAKHDSSPETWQDLDVRFRSSRYSDAGFAPKLTIVIGSDQNELESAKESLGLLSRQSNIDKRKEYQAKAKAIAESQAVTEQLNASFSIQPGTWIFQPNWFFSNSILDLNLTLPFERQLISGAFSESQVVNMQSIELELTSTPVFSHTAFDKYSQAPGPVVSSTDPSYYLIEKINDTHYRFYFDDGFHYEGIPPEYSNSGVEQQDSNCAPIRYALPPDSNLKPPEGNCPTKRILPVKLPIGSSQAGAGLEVKLPYYNDGSFELYLKPSGTSPDGDGLCTPEENQSTSPIDCFYLKMVYRSYIPKASAAIRQDLGQAFAASYNSNLETAPSFVRGLLGNETVHLKIKMKDGTTKQYDVSANEIGKIVDKAIPEASQAASPTIVLSTSQAIVEKITSSKNPAKEFKAQWGNDIKYEGKNWLSSVKLSIASIFLK